MESAQPSISFDDQKFTFEITLYDAGLIYTALRKLARNALMYEHNLHEFVKEIMDVIAEWDEKISHSEPRHPFYKSGTFRSTPELELFHITLNGKIYYADDIEKKISAIMSFRSWQVIHAALRTISKEEIIYPTYYLLPAYKMLRKRVTPQMRLEYHDLIKGSIERILRMLTNADYGIK